MGLPRCVAMVIMMLLLGSCKDLAQDPSTRKGPVPASESYTYQQPDDSTSETPAGTTPPPNNSGNSTPQNGNMSAPVPDNESINCLSQVGATKILSNAPAPYGSASHDRIAGFQLGLLSTLGAQSCDSDGVKWGDPLKFDSTRYITVDTRGAGGILYAWIDFNGDGDFSDPGELVITIDEANPLYSPNRSPGLKQYEIHIPSNTTGKNILTTWARFRWGANMPTPSPYGHSIIGEVEDYQIEISN